MCSSRGLPRAVGEEAVVVAGRGESGELTMLTTLPVLLARPVPAPSCCGANCCCNCCCVLTLSVPLLLATLALRESIK